MNFFFFLTLISIQIPKIQIKSKLNPNPLFCSSFFLCLQGQPELCGSYHLLQSCFSFFIRLHDQPESFGSCIILQSCSSFFFCLHGQPELFASDHLLQFYFLLQLIFITLLQSFESGYSSCSFGSPSCSIFFVSYPQLSFLCSSVSEALFALRFLFLSERCFFFSFFFVHANAALAFSRNE